MNKTEATLNHHLQAFHEGNIEELMADYTEQSVMILEDKLIKGIDNIRAFNSEVFENIFPPGSEYELKHSQVVGDIAYIVWSGGTDKLSFKLGTDTFVMKNGKILQQTAAVLIEPK